MTTTSRLLRLLSLLQARRDWPGPLLAERLQVSHRTVRRDVDRLRAMGYTIHAAMGPAGGYRLGTGSELPPLLFDEEQTLAIAVALQTAAVSGIDIEEAAVRALTTIRQVMPSRHRHRLDALEVTGIPGAPGGAAPVRVPVATLTELATAVRAREVLRFDYATRGRADGRPPERHRRRVEPHHVVTAHGRWYLLGWDLDREDWRLFSAERISPRIPTGPRFTVRTVPGGDVRVFVAARFKGSDVDEWPCRGTVLLDLPASEVLPFAGDGTVRAVGPDRCTLEVGSWSWGALAASFGRFEVAMEVVEPPELVDAFAVQAARYAATAHGDESGARVRSGGSGRGQEEDQ